MKTLSENLSEILSDLQKYKITSKEELENKYIQTRLEKTIEDYYSSLIKSFSLLKEKEEISLLRNISKEDKNDRHS